MSQAPPADYLDFLRRKVATAPVLGFRVAEADVHSIAKAHQRRIVPWMVLGGRRACFAAFGLGKSLIQIEAVRLTRAHAGGRGLISCPLNVRHEFMRDAAMLGTTIRFIRRTAEAEDPEGLYLTNHESVREGHIDPEAFTVASVDEAAVLRGFGGTKTFREFMRLFAGDDGGTGQARRGVPFRYLATAMPAPNDFIEILAYAAYLGIMQVSEAKTRFFKRNSEKADQLQLLPHKAEEFWRWVGTWAVFVQKPSDLDPSFSDEGYDLPALDVRWHEVEDAEDRVHVERNGQGRMLPAPAAISVQTAAREKRDSLSARISKLMELRAEDPAAHRIIWHDLEAERKAIETAIPGIASVYGAQDLETREELIAAFQDGRIPELAAKPVMLGSGTNMQRHCAWAIFLGIGFKLHDFIQAIHRLYRFLQARDVRVDLIHTAAERGVRKLLEIKWAQHKEMVRNMTELIREHGLSNADLADALGRSFGVERVEVVGENYRLVNTDAVEEARRLPDASVDLIVTSIPFSTQYEYTPSYRDLGHTDDDAHFFEHLGFLTPHLLRVLKPGRVAAVHVKDRIVPGGLRGLGFQTVSRFSDKTAAHFERHGFAFLARKTIVTDVVRENNQTYRLGWTEQCKDGSRMGCGLPEYVLLFRKPPTDHSNGYADEPVVKAKKYYERHHTPECMTTLDPDTCICAPGRWVNEGGYSRARWQIDAHGFMRSNGNRHLTPEEIADLAHADIFKAFRKYSLEQVYDYEHHVRIGEALEAKMRLPVTFMLLQPASWHPDVWTDVTRMRTLNGLQAAKGKEMHLCPLQFDIVERLIAQMSQPGELVFDPFGGLMTVPYCAVRLGRRGLAFELNPGYFADGAAYCASVVRRAELPTLFSMFDADGEEPPAEATA